MLAEVDKARKFKCVVSQRDARAAETWKNTLERLGAEVSICSTTKATLAAISRSRFELLVIGLRFNDGDGEQIVLHANSLPSPAPRVVVFGSMDALRPARLRAMGALVLDNNPNPEILTSAALEILRRSRGLEGRDLPEPITLPAQTRMERGVRRFVNEFRLSPQQAYLTACLTARLSNKEIAAELGVSPDSIRIQLGRIVEKIGGRGTKRRDEVLAALAVFCVGEMD